MSGYVWICLSYMSRYVWICLDMSGYVYTYEHRYNDIMKNAKIKVSPAVNFLIGRVKKNLPHG